MYYFCVRMDIDSVCTENFPVGSVFFVITADFIKYKIIIKFPLTTSFVRKSMLFCIGEQLTVQNIVTFAQLILKLINIIFGNIIAYKYNKVESLMKLEKFSYVYIRTTPP
ncbi:hypothetical protein SAMN02745190_01588 [Schwartzia succinivorans DSM 10502]|jgi:hypothetical protein|uniref:Uncharacterized protein n=1 Tax=Schwartzia succinivorans DSM 10502 TaxID=1123243 RepID=A0A1M4XSS0_9FIRM|nr:hypothetical protein SAMN02745190_01588 [Schwartzia succinivorans DSM 10502]